MDFKQELEWLLKNTTTQEEAFNFFDKLETVEISMLQGLWKGKELRTGHPMDGLLNACRWYGKRFDNKENVHPLVFETGTHKLYFGNPGLLPLKLPYEKIPRSIISILFSLINPLIRTKKSKARLRLVEYRGKVSASMLYDQLAIIDVFRKVDDNTVIGVMDFKDSTSSKNYFFVLERV
ncbi:MAG: DUF4334 domain-containing protein [Clostridiaceae bacterium]